MARFELPALNFKFGSLTDGTDIPPPLPSPIQEEPPELPKTPQPPADGATHNGTTNGVKASSTGTQTTPESRKNSVKRFAEDDPVSPISSHRQGSIRRLFSRNQLNTTYANGGITTVGEHNGFEHLQKPDSRPNSRSTSVTTEKRAKRTSGWFRRLRGDHSADHVSSNGGVEKNNKRMSRMLLSEDDDLPVEVAKPAGPPPPKLPEFRALGSKVDLADDAGSLGSDLFKNIK